MALPNSKEILAFWTTRLREIADGLEAGAIEIETGKIEARPFTEYFSLTLSGYVTKKKHFSLEYHGSEWWEREKETEDD